MHGSEPPTLGLPTPPAQALLVRMQGGDREAVGEFITRYGDQIRRRVRGKLGRSMRRVFDSQEILSTVARRLDEIVLEGRLGACVEGQLFSLVFQIASNAVIDKTRIFARLSRVEDADEPFAHELHRHLQAAEALGSDACDLSISELLRALPDSTDRAILEMWLREVPLVGVAHALGIPDGTVRRRWMKAKERLMEWIERRGDA